MNPEEKIRIAKELWGDLLLFTKVFFKYRTGRDFETPHPIGRMSHYKIISDELTNVVYGKSRRLMINVPPGYGKSELVIHTIAWALSRFPDSSFLYISHSHDLASKHTYTIKQIIELPQYRELFDVRIKHDSSAKDNFKTNYGGAVVAFGSKGAITGHDGGRPYLDRFSGGVFIDDIHKPDEVHSDSIRENVKRNYIETIAPRARGENVPIVFLGQRLHEDDVPANLERGYDGENWKIVKLKALDDSGNALCPKLNSKEALLRKQEVTPYVFASQYQQNPQPAGGGIFKPEWFVLLDEEPKILTTFIVADTAETEKTYNDPTVFTFFGVYKIMNDNTESGIYGLHILDCVEDWFEPKDLKYKFMQFWQECMRHSVQPKVAAIEKKSSGSTLISVMREVQGLQILDIERTSKSGSKVSRFLNVQEYVASRRVSLPKFGRHTEKVVEHMRKITANDSHRHDDIADTVSDGIDLALISKVITAYSLDTTGDEVLAKASAFYKQQATTRRELW